MNKKQKEQAERIISGFSIGVLCVIAYKFNEQYNKRAAENDKLKETIKKYNNIYISNVLHELMVRQQASQITDYERRKIIQENDLMRDLEMGIIERYPTAAEYVDEKMRVIRLSPNYIKSGTNK